MADDLREYDLEDEESISSQDTMTENDGKRGKDKNSERDDANNSCTAVSKCKEESEGTGKVHITELPTEIVQHILKYLSFDTIAKVRLVSRYFNNMCSSLLNSEFNQLRVLVQQRFQAIKSQMPRRESSRRKHPLARESDIIETLYMRLTLLNMTFGKHIERKYCCFFPGEIIDEIYKILKYVEKTPSLSRAYKVTDELFDLSTMAMEYFKEHIEPSLPEVTYFASDVFEYPSFSSVKAQHSISEETAAASSALETPRSAPECSLQSLNKKVKTITKKVNRNFKEIGHLKRNAKGLSQKINSLGEVINQMKWKQKKCDNPSVPDSHKLNEILVQLNLCKHEIELLTSKLSNCADKRVKVDLESLETCLQNSTRSLNSIGTDDTFDIGTSFRRINKKYDMDESFDSDTSSRRKIKKYDMDDSFDSDTSSRRKNKKYDVDDSFDIDFSSSRRKNKKYDVDEDVDQEVKQQKSASSSRPARRSIKRKAPCNTITSLDEYYNSLNEMYERSKRSCTFAADLAIQDRNLSNDS